MEHNNYNPTLSDAIVSICHPHAKSPRKDSETITFGRILHRPDILAMSSLFKLYVFPYPNYIHFQYTVNGTSDPGFDAASITFGVGSLRMVHCAPLSGDKIHMYDGQILTGNDMELTGLVTKPHHIELACEVSQAVLAQGL